MWQSLPVSDVFSNVSAWLTVPEAAELLEVPLGRVRRLIEDHHLISIKRDGVQYVPAELIVDKEPLPSLHGTIVVLLDAGFDLNGAIVIPPGYFVCTDTTAATTSALQFTFAWEEVPI